MFLVKQFKGLWWLYKTNNNFLLFEIIGITGGIIKIFQTINNTISRYMLGILRRQIKKNIYH